MSAMLTSAPKSPNPAMHRTGSGRHEPCLRTSRAALRLSVIFVSLGAKSIDMNR